MVNPALCQFNNYRSVRFNLDNFALPVVGTKKKNTIYTNYLEGLKGTQQLTLKQPQPTYGYDHAVQWGFYIFASNDEGLFFANKYKKEFEPLDQLVFPRQIAVSNDRLFLLGLDRDRITYSVDLMGEWANGTFLEDAVFIPADYGLCFADHPDNPGGAEGQNFYPAESPGTSPEEVQHGDIQIRKRLLPLRFPS